jgi:hypothetical protein
MFKTRPFLLTALLLASLALTVAGQSPPPRIPPALPSMLRNNVPVRGTPGQSDTPGSQARTFISQGESLIGEGKAAEAKEALRTAIRIEPMNLEAWALYDYATELHYVGRAREEKVNPVIERDLQPLFSLQKIDSYQEYNTLYLVGEIRNLSIQAKENIEISGFLLDENKQELRKETGALRLIGRGLFPNESSLFEIAFRDPPPGVKSYRVRVTRFD